MDLTRNSIGKTRSRTTAALRKPGSGARSRTERDFGSLVTRNICPIEHYLDKFEVKYPDRFLATGVMLGGPVF